MKKMAEKREQVQREREKKKSLKQTDSRIHWIENFVALQFSYKIKQKKKNRQHKSIMRIALYRRDK